MGTSYGPGSNCYVIEGNFLAYRKSGEQLLSISAIIYNQIAGRIYKPCKIVGPAFPWVEIGDGITCYTTDVVIETYCLTGIMRNIQGMMDTYEAKGSFERGESFGLTTYIIQLEVEAAVIKKSVEEVSVWVTDLKEYTEAQFVITSEEIAAEVKKVNRRRR